MDTDICIVGAGAAGITLALQLASKPLSLVLLESGGLVPDPNTQALYKGLLTGLPNHPLDVCRLRYFGGSTGHWGGWCRPFDRIDFADRPWVSNSVWPISFDELARYFPRAREICGIPDPSYDPADWELAAAPALPLSGEDVITRLVRFSLPLHFGTVYRAELDAATNVRVVLHSNVTSIDVDPNGQHVERLSVATLDGHRFSVRARHYVLAAGGIENPRLLLVSNKVMTHGVGNDHDQVGRYFMDHLQLDCAQVVPLASDLNLRLYQRDSRHTMRQSKLPGVAPAGMMGYLALSESLQRREGILNFSGNLYMSSWSDYFLHRQNGDPIHKTRAQKTRGALETLRDNFGGAARMAWERLLSRKERPFYKIQATQEQAPNPNSRVTLGRDVDALGIPRARLDWQLSALDRYSLMKSLEHICRAVDGSNLVRINVPLDFTKHDLPSYMRGSWHHIGTTRMSADARTGVVDANCKVHGLDNVFISGSSVFPTCGSGNPTLNIVAMCVRLADHLTVLNSRRSVHHDLGVAP